MGSGWAQAAVMVRMAARVFMELSRNVFRSEVGDEGGGDSDRSVGLLALLKQCDVEARQRGTGTVEGVRETVFTLLVLEAQLHPARLVIAEARAARHLQVFPVAGRPDFDVVGFCRGLADVSGAE